MIRPEHSMPGVGRRPRRRGVVALPLQDVGPVEPGRRDLHEHLARAGHRIGHLLQAQDLGSAGLGDDDRSHEVSPDCRSRGLCCGELGSLGFGGWRPSGPLPARHSPTPMRAEGKRPWLIRTWTAARRQGPVRLARWPGRDRRTPDARPAAPSDAAADPGPGPAAANCRMPPRPGGLSARRPPLDAAAGPLPDAYGPPEDLDAADAYGPADEYDTADPTTSRPWCARPGGRRL